MFRSYGSRGQKSARPKSALFAASIGFQLNEVDEQVETSAFDQFCTLSESLVGEILLFLPTSFIIHTIRRVHHFFGAALERPDLWNELFFRDFPFAEPSSSPSLDSTLSPTQLAWRDYKNEYEDRESRRVSGFVEFSAQDYETNPSDTLLELKVCLVGHRSCGKTSVLTRFLRDDFSPACAPTIAAEYATDVMTVNLLASEESSATQIRRRRQTIHQIRASQRLSRYSMTPHHFKALSLTPTSEPQLLEDSVSQDEVEQSYERQLRGHFWDTTGNPMLESILATYVSDADLVLVVFSLTDPESADRATTLFRRMRALNSAVWGLVGNKLDVASRIRDSNVWDLSGNGNGSGGAAIRVVETESLFESLSEYSFWYYEVSAESGENVQEMFEDLAKKAIVRKNRSQSG